jgi:hypothetical protein
MIVLKIVLWILLATAGAIAAFFACCVIAGFVLGVAEGLGLRRQPRFKVVRVEEEE